LALVAGQHAAAAQELGHAGPDLSCRDESSRVTQVASSPVKRAFQAAGRIVPPVRVLHLPVNLAGTGWAHVNALRRKGIDARLLVFWPQKWRPQEDDINLHPPPQGVLPHTVGQV